MTVWNEAGALCVRPEGLPNRSEEVFDLWHMILDAKVQAQTGPGTENLQGLFVAASGVWIPDATMEWQVEGTDEVALETR